MQSQYAYVHAPRPKIQQKRKYRFLCPKCGKYGYLGKGWARNPRIRYKVFYIRHYDSEVYHRQMVRYRNHEIKSRPNGQRRCYVPNAHFEIIDGVYHLTGCEGECNRIEHKLPGLPYTEPRFVTLLDRALRILKSTRPLPPQEQPLPLAVRAAAL